MGIDIDPSDVFTFVASAPALDGSARVNVRDASART